jgi:hypothetical protein
VTSPTEIPAVDRLGEQLERALRERRRARRWLKGRRLVPAVAVAIALSVPALATQVDWADLAGGRTPLPTQAPADQRLTLARGEVHAGAWSVVGYRARLAEAGGRVGTCLFLTTAQGGSGRCVVPERMAALTLIADGQYPAVVAAGLVVRRADAVELDYGHGVRRRVRPRPLGGALEKTLCLPDGAAVFVAPPRQRAPFIPRSAIAFDRATIVGRYP